MTFITYIFIYIFIIYINIILCIKEIIIHHDNFDNIKNIIKDNQDDDELIIKFIENYYNMTYLDYDTDITVLSKITIIGNENGTIFDYDNKRKGVLNVIFTDAGEKNKYLNIYNIIFKNFMDKKIVYYGINIMKLITHSDRFFFTLSNCKFQNNYGNIFYLISQCSKSTHEEPSIVFNNCSFE